MKGDKDMRKIFLPLALAVAIFAGCGAQANEISDEKAKEIALKHAGLTIEQVSHMKAERERDDKRAVYDVEFYSKDKKEYDYEIDAETGEIISHDTDAETISPAVDSNSLSQDTSASQNKISEEDAKKAALSKVPGATDADIRKFKKDIDDGREEYEGEIIYKNTEYEFEIDAQTGEIIKWESEAIND